MFVGREEELNILNKVLKSAKNQNILMYGRRRVGKTELISEVIKDKNAIYFEASEDIAANDIERLSLLIGEYYKLPLSFKDIREALVFLFEKGIQEDLVFVIDEYPYLRNTIIGLDSIIQNVIDEYRHKSKLKLILCGSFVDVMKNILEYENPLYGRFETIVDLKQMDYYDASKFYINYSPEDKIALYSVFGGIPFYNFLIDEEQSVEENIINLLLSSSSVLFKEVENYLKLEVAKIASANAVFDVVATGSSKFSDILNRSHLPSSAALSDVLSKLNSMEIIKKEAPINDLNNRKKTKYYIDDNLTLFYYSFIYRYRSQLAVMDKRAFYKRYVEKELYTSYIPKVFESICKQFLIRKNKRDDLFTLIGKYYYDDPKTKTNGEFDVVTEDEKGYVFYECKYIDKKIDDKMIENEIKQVVNTGLNCYKYGFFSKSGYALKTVSDNLILYTLEDLFKPL